MDREGRARWLGARDWWGRSALSLVALANLAVAVVYVVLFFALLGGGLSRGADYTAFYTAWRILLEGKGQALYDPAVQAHVQREVLGGQTFQAGLSPFANPPQVVLPLVPLGLLPLTVSYVVWSVVELGLLILLVKLLLGSGSHWSRGDRLMLLGWLLAFPALAITFFQGAFSLVVAVAIVAAYRSLARGQDRAAGVWLVLASVKPQALIGPFVAVVVGNRWRAVATAIAGGLIAGAIATVVLGPGIWGGYASLLADYTSSFDRLSVDPAVMWNLRGTLTLILGRGDAGLINVLGYLGLGVGVVATAFLWRRGMRHNGGEADQALRFSLTIVLTLFFSPHLNPQDDILVVVAAILAYGALQGSRIGTLLAVGASVAPVAILLTNGLRADAPTSLPVRIPTLLILGLAVLLLVGLRGRALRMAPSANGGVLGRGARHAVLEPLSAGAPETRVRSSFGGPVREGDSGPRRWGRRR